MRSGVSPAIWRPSNSIEPFLGGRKPQMARSVVLLPAPFAPIMATISPRSISSETLRSVSASS